MGASQFGCSGSDLGAEVSGTVTLDGKPVGPGTVVFAEASGASNPSDGAIQPDGSYALKTANLPGIAPGKYRAAVTVFEDVKTAPGERSFALPKYVTPEKYANLDTSGLEYDVKPGKNPIDIALTAK